MKNIFAIAFLIAGALLTSTAITTMIPAAYADNEVKAEDDSIAQITDCDDNELDENVDVNSDFCDTFTSVGSPP